MARIIALQTADLAQFFPRDERNTPTDDIAYTLDRAHVFGGDVPAYKDPAHLAAWLHGFCTMHDMALEAFYNDQEGN